MAILFRKTMQLFLHIYCTIFVTFIVNLLFTDAIQCIRLPFVVAIIKVDIQCSCLSYASTAVFENSAKSFYMSFIFCQLREENNRLRLQLLESQESAHRHAER